MNSDFVMSGCCFTSQIKLNDSNFSPKNLCVTKCCSYINTCIMKLCACSWSFVAEALYTTFSCVGFNGHVYVLICLVITIRIYEWKKCLLIASLLPLQVWQRRWRSEPSDKVERMNNKYNKLWGSLVVWQYCNITMLFCLHM